MRQLAIEATPVDADSLRALLPAGGEPDAPLGYLSSELVGAKVDAPDGLTVTYEGMIQYRSVDVLPDLTFLLDIAGGVSAGLITHWILGRFRGRTSRLTINRRLVEFDDEGRLTRLIEEQIEQGAAAEE